MKPEEIALDRWKWKWEDGSTIRIYSEDYGTIFLLHADKNVKAQMERMEPVARLIAAAPSMGACLQEIADSYLTPKTVASRARAELAKI